MENNNANIPEKDNDVVVPEVSAEEITVSAMESAKKNKKTGFFKSRGFKYGSFATAMTALLIIVVIAANMALSMLSDRFSWSLDFTSTGMYDISDATKQVVNSLDPSVSINITVFYNENKYPYYLSEPIKRFANLSDNINVTYIDPEKSPASLNRYGTEYNVGNGAVVVENGDRIRVFNTNDYLEQDQETGSTYIYIEERLAAGVLFVTKDQIPVVYFANGHGEDGYSGLMNLFANNGAEVKEINLMTDTTGFDPASELMVICNPKRDYSEAEIRRLDDFLNNGNMLGRNLMYFSSTDAISVPNLEKYLREWGIEFNNDMVLDSKYCVGTTPYMVIPQFTTEEIMNTGSVPSSVTSPIVPNARSVNLLFDENVAYKTQALITTFEESSYSKDKNVVTTTWDKQDSDKPGPFTLAAMSMKYKYINNVQAQSYVLAAGSSDMLESNILTYSGNGEYIMQLYKLMIDEQDDTILAARKSSSSTVAAIDKNTTLTMTLIVLVIIPLICLIIGLVVYIRRRFM